MRKKLIIYLLYLIVVIMCFSFLGLILGPFLYWGSLPSTALNVWVIDKTVPNSDYREHQGLMWVLNYNKITNQNTGQYFKSDKDYIGFFPGDNASDIRQLSSVKESPDLIYLTDTYGIYSNDYLLANKADTQPELLYGGLNQEEIEAIQTKVGNGNTIIGEFNIAADPTNELSRIELGKIFGLKWTGWKGRYFRDLTKSIEVPQNIIDNYEKQTQKKWDYTGEGFLLLSDTNDIVVLKSEQEVSEKGLTVSFRDGYQSEFDIQKQIPYQYWFEIAETRTGRETIADFELHLTTEGKALLERIGIPSRFPAVIRDKNEQYTSYYFAGDFTDISHVNGLWRYYGISQIKRLTSKFNEDSSDFFYWNCYIPMMNKIINDIKLTRRQEENLPAKNQSRTLQARTSVKGFEVLRDGKWQEFFVKGVNIGAALPGKWFTEFPEDEDIYLDWLEKIGEMNANTVRIYTLLPPEFYKALDHYNRLHPEAPIWLLQEIWPEENPEGHDYLKQSYLEEYNQEIEYVIDAIHGTANIGERTGRAYGRYTEDVSNYVLGYLVGRELEPDEVLTTNKNNSGYHFSGEYLSAIKEASPTEAWLAMNCDYVLSYEERTYGSQHPVAIVSWPTLDVLEHDSEWNAAGLKSIEYNDKVSIDINHLNSGPKMQAGLFGAYHIYPNYPDFMNNESKYKDYTDEEGRFRYGGYLKEFIENHTQYPALVAEFGLATGMGNAHTSPDGYNHGGLTEVQQGEGIVRMMKAIQREGYAGGVIFEWMDEWAKKTWITEPYMIPYERHVFWHNAQDPEQNYGILAMESQKIDQDEYIQKGSGILQQISLSHDATYLYLDVELNKSPDFSSEKLFIGIDTYDRTAGERRFSPALSEEAPSGLEFLLDLDRSGKSKILVHPGYNIASNRFASFASSNGIFEQINPLINNTRVTKDGVRIKEIYQDGSSLNYGKHSSNSYNHWFIEGQKIHIRLPWAKLNISDPSSLQVINDNGKIQETDGVKTITTDGILVSALLYNKEKNEKADLLSTGKPYIWEPWDVPIYQERLKKSYYIIQEYFNTLN